MSTVANKELVTRWFEEAWNKGRADAIDEMVAPRAVAHGLGPIGVTGPGGIKAFHARFNAAFSNVRVRIESIVAEGDLVAVRWTRTATHSGKDLGFPATGRTVTFGGMLFVRVQDGMLVESWNCFDKAGLLQQLGQSNLSFAP
jgi:steroid delta-isomerase-like uncharacterized protein